MTGQLNLKLNLISLLILLSQTLPSLEVAAQHSPVHKASSAPTAQNKRQNEQLLPDTDFANNKFWFFKNAKLVASLPPVGVDMVALSPATAAESSFSFAGISIKNIPTNRSLNFDCMLQSEFGGQKLMINAFAYDKDGKLVTSWTDNFTAPKMSWQKFTTSYVAPPGVTELRIFVINNSKHLAWAVKPSLATGTPAKAKISATTSYPQNTNPNDTKILQARVTTPVRTLHGTANGVITFPIPALYGQQIPLTYEVYTEPASALVSYKIHKREDGINYVCDATVAVTDTGTKVIWQGLVLVNGKAMSKPPLARAAVPPEIAQWSKSTLCAQSDDPQIRAKAAELAKGAPDVESYARKVIAFTSSNKGTGAKFDKLDAVSALSCGGSCTSRANLGAALLRANGIPARTMSHLPAWCTTPLFEHWLTEYWHPGVGWIPLETTLGTFQDPPNTIVTLAISSKADEDMAADPVHLRVIMPGAAYLSGAEVSDNLRLAPIPHTDGVNTATVIGVLQSSPAELAQLNKAAQQNFSRAYGAQANDFARRHAMDIEKAAEKGDASALARILIGP